LIGCESNGATSHEVVYLLSITEAVEKEPVS
jgi:hypothetical protein